MTLTDHVIYGALWLSFGVLHSALASDTAKLLTGQFFGARERLAYNLIAVAHVGAVWLAGMFALNGESASGFHLASVVRVGLWISLGTGVVIILVAYSHYDGGGFTGLHVGPGTVKP